jgi:hypothetical protein
MPKENTETNAKAPAEVAAEPANISVYVLIPRTKIGKAICGKGRLPFPLTATQAKTLEAMGKVRIDGIN